MTSLSGEQRQPEEYIQAQRSPQFQQLRSAHRRFVVPMTVFFMLWFLLFVLLSIYAPQFMGMLVFGSVSLGMILGLLQFVSTFAITAAYVVYANKVLDPQAAALREGLENGSFLDGEHAAGADGGRA